jgi:hypothetical protein
MDDKLDKKIDHIRTRRKFSMRKDLIPAKPLPIKTKFLGQLTDKKETQEFLDELNYADRVAALTEDNRHKVCERLDLLKEQENFKDGLALWKEYKEALDDNQAETFPDFEIAFWWSSAHLKALHDRKSQFEYWKNMEEQ